MHLILPVSGQSSRYPGLRPKWMLTHPQGDLMLVEAFKGINLAHVESIVVICLRRHHEEYGVENMLIRQFEKINLKDKLKIAIIESSTSQPHTIYQGIKLLNITGPILVKDSDNFFKYTPKPGNAVCYLHLADANIRTAANKSYIMLNEMGSVVNIVEKRIISDTFCVGGYSFSDALLFNATFEKIGIRDDLYVSHIIYQMILDGVSFRGSEVSGFLDWGTLNDWNDYRSRFCTLFIDLDGTLVKNSAEYFAPFWGETEAIKENVHIINKIYDSGYGEIIVTTSRSQDSDELTRRQLSQIGLKYHRILFSLFHGKRIVINDYSASNPYRSCDAINLARNSNELASLLPSLFSLQQDSGNT